MNPNEQPQTPVQPESQPNVAPQPPIAPVVPMAAPQYNQAPAPDTNAFQEQPKVQYVVMQKSLEGLGGWLAFFMVLFSFAVLGCIGNVFSKDFGFETFTNLFLAVGYGASVVLIALRKKMALWVIYATIALSLLSAVITNIINETTSEAGQLIGFIAASVVFHGLLALYFYASKRVKATLTK